MLMEIAMLGVVVGVVAGLFEASTRPLGLAAGSESPEAAIRVALAGPEASAVAAEFRRRGVIPPGVGGLRGWELPAPPM